MAKAPSLLDYAAVAAYLFTIAATFGVEQVAPDKSVSDRYPTPLTPPGWAFSIWGLIFISQGAMLALFMLQPGSIKQGNVTPWLISGWVCEGAWQLAALLPGVDTQHTLVICTPVLVFGAYAFIKALLACSTVLGSVPNGVPMVSKFLLITSTAVNAAWVTVAASLSILVALKANTDFSLIPVAAVLAILIASIGAILTMSQNSAAYGLTLVWAFWAIHKTNSDGGLVDNLSLGCTVLFAVLSIVVIVKNIRKRQEPTPENDATAGDALLQA